MKVKFTALFLFLGMIIYGQTKEALIVGVEKLYDSSYNLDFDSVLDATYPKIFEVADRDVLYQILDSSFQNDDFGIRLVHPKVNLNVSEIKEIDGKKVALITYNSAIRMTFVQKMTLDESQRMLSGLQESMKNKKVIYESSRNSYLIEGKDIIIAISDEFTKNDWKYITYDEAQKPMLLQMLGENVLKVLGL